jgi:hypothetical protein
VSTGLTLFKVHDFWLGIPFDQRRDRSRHGLRTKGRSIDKGRGEPDQGYSQGDERFHFGADEQ